MQSHPTIVRLVTATRTLLPFHRMWQKAQPHSTSLRRQLAWLVIAIVIPALAFGLMGVILQYRAERANAARGAVELASDLGAVLEADLKARSAALQTIALSPSLAAGDLTTFRSQLQEMISVQFPGSSIRLWDAEGKQVLNTAVPPGVTLPPLSPPADLKQVFAAKSSGFWSAYGETEAGNESVLIDVPVQREDGAVAYALSMTPASNLISGQMRVMPIEHDWTVSVADRAGIILARNRDGADYVGKKAGPIFFSRVSRPGAYIAEVVNRLGTPVLMTYRQSQPSGWTVVVGIPRSDLIAPARYLAIMTLAAGIMLLLLGLITARVIARRITGPINALRLLSTAGDRGLYPSAHFATGLREVDEVGRALVKFITELRDSRAELAWVNADLEARVLEALAASEAARERLAQGQKIQALGQLAGGIAHDFNNILQTVIGTATLIQRRPEDGERIKRLARLTLEAVSRGASITQRLLSFARRGKLSAEPIETAAVLDGIREVLAHTLGSPIIVRADTKPGTPAIFADRGQLETALLNLGVNARDAMPNGGTLTISARAEHISPETTHEAGLAAGDYVRIAVEDTGSGMDAATLGRIIEPFFTTKPPGEGTGLGLSIVRSFAEQSGGAVLIESTQGVGTVVTLWLRQRPGDEPTPHPAPATKLRQHTRSPAYVLLVDDDDLVRETLVAQLEDLGFATRAASSGRDALALLDAHEVVDALVCDLSMPGLNGLQTIRAAHQRRPALPCFLLTGDMGEVTSLPQSDVFTALRKPLTGATLASHIQAALAA